MANNTTTALLSLWSQVVQYSLPNATTVIMQCGWLPTKWLAFLFVFSPAIAGDDAASNLSFLILALLLLFLRLLYNNTNSNITSLCNVMWESSNLTPFSATFNY